MPVPRDQDGSYFIMRHKVMTSFVLLIGGFIFGGNYYLSHSTGKTNSSSATVLDALATDDKSVTENGPIATVNGVEISREEYQYTLKDITKSLSRAGYDMTNNKILAQVRQQAIATLINTELVVQDARADGLSISTTEINQAYQAVLDDMGSEEVLALTLKDAGRTEKDLRTELERNLLVDKYLADKTSYKTLVVTEAEVKDYYDKISANNSELASYDSEKASLKNKLQQQKRQQAVSQFIQSLREKAEVEILI